MEPLAAKHPSGKRTQPISVEYFLSEKRTTRSCAFQIEPAEFFTDENATAYQEPKNSTDIG